MLRVDDHGVRMSPAQLDQPLFHRTFTGVGRLKPDRSALVAENEAILIRQRPAVLIDTFRRRAVDTGLTLIPAFGLAETGLLAGFLVMRLTALAFLPHLLAAPSLRVVPCLGTRTSIGFGSGLIAARKRTLTAGFGVDVQAFALVRSRRTRNRTLARQFRCRSLGSRHSRIRRGRPISLARQILRLVDALPRCFRRHLLANSIRCDGLAPSILVRFDFVSLDIADQCAG